MAEIFDRLDKTVREISTKSNSIFAVSAVCVAEDMIRPMLPPMPDPTTNRVLGAIYSGVFFVIKVAVAM